MEMARCCDRKGQIEPIYYQEPIFPGLVGWGGRDGRSVNTWAEKRKKKIKNWACARARQPSELVNLYSFQIAFIHLYCAVVAEIFRRCSVRPQSHHSLITGTFPPFLFFLNVFFSPPQLLSLLLCAELKRERGGWTKGCDGRVQVPRDGWRNVRADGELCTCKTGRRASVFPTPSASPSYWGLSSRARSTETDRNPSTDSNSHSYNPIALGRA